MKVLAINDVVIEDTFAEAFPMTACRLLVTAGSPAWALTAAQTATGYAASVIGCDAEAGLERPLAADETPDGRPGGYLLVTFVCKEGSLGSGNEVVKIERP